MKNEGRDVIRIDDRTDHGGKVISCSSGTIVMGKPAALANDLTYCPKCKGQFAIKPDGKGAKHMGRSYAYHDDVTECGARLISSLATAGSPHPTSEQGSETTQEAQETVRFDDRFVILDHETCLPAAFRDYAIKREDGRIEHGRTNQRGETHLLSASDLPESVEIYVE